MYRNVGDSGLKSIFIKQQDTLSLEIVVMLKSPHRNNFLSL